RVLRGPEALELRDIRPRDERLAAGALQDEHAYLRIAVHLLARRQQCVIHRPRHRVARLGPVERQNGKRRIDLEEGFCQVSSTSTKRIQPRRTRRSRRILWVEWIKRGAGRSRGCASSTSRR